MTDHDHKDLRQYLQYVHGHLQDLHYDTLLMHRLIRCPICHFEGARDAFAVRQSVCQFDGSRLERYVCPDCDLLFGPMKMLDLTDAQLEAEYRMLYDGYEENDSPDAEIRAFFACDPQPGGLYLNWGCGAWSPSIEQLRSEGWDVWGYEPYAPSRSPFVVSSRDEISAKFDGIFSNNLIEHLHDPVRSLTDMAQHLTTNGKMVHASPCYEMLYEHTRFHLHFFLGRSLQLLAAASGFSVERTEPVGEYVQAVFTRTHVV